jgi:hypothetical protein
MRPHVRVDSSGNVIRYRDYRFQVYLRDWADVETWLTYLGEIMWFLPSWHDQATHDADAYEVFVEQVGEPDIAGVQQIGSVYQGYIAIPVMVRETK